MILIIFNMSDSNYKDSYGDDKDDSNSVSIKTFAEELKYISSYSEIRKPETILRWAAKFLEDIMRLEENNWRIIMRKFKKNDSDLLVLDEEYMPVLIDLSLIRPSDDNTTYNRLKVDLFEQRKFNKEDKTESLKKKTVKKKNKK